MKCTNQFGINNATRQNIITYLIGFTLILTSCNKLVEIDPPVDTITTEQVFLDDANANAAVTGIYSIFAEQNFPQSFANGGTALATGLSSDELLSSSSAVAFAVIYRNDLVQQGPQSLIDQLWRKAYEVLYPINSCLENLQNSPGITPIMKSKLAAEVKFLKALVYFNLVNLFGDVPLVESTKWNESRLTPKMAKTDIYGIIIKDLLAVKDNLPSDYMGSNNERVRVTRWAVDALLARLYLYNQNWTGAESEATAVINSTQFSLNSNLNGIFLKNSSEAILQWQYSSSVGSSTQNITAEGYNFIPLNNRPPNFYLSESFLNAFEANDQRKSNWIKTVTYLGRQFSFPYKYKKGQPDIVVGGPVTEYSMVLRLGEQYLIRAEARAKLNNLDGAKTDLDMIRVRAGLQKTTAITQAEILAAIEQERKVELFTESGHRWFDLKRTGRIDAVMGLVTPFKSNGGSWKTHQQTYPIPYGELVLNPNLRQNEGY